MFHTFTPHPSHTLLSNEQGHSPAHIPMIYETIPGAPQKWEYHVLTVDLATTKLPDIQQLNDLGQERWIFVGLLDERTTTESYNIHYYFARPILES